MILLYWLSIGAAVALASLSNETNIEQNQCYSPEPYTVTETETETTTSYGTSTVFESFYYSYGQTVTEDRTITITNEVTISIIDEETSKQQVTEVVSDVSYGSYPTSSISCSANWYGWGTVCITITIWIPTTSAYTKPVTVTAIITESTTITATVTEPTTITESTTITEPTTIIETLDHTVTDVTTTTTTDTETDKTTTTTTDITTEIDTATVTNTTITTYTTVLPTTTTSVVTTTAFVPTTIVFNSTLTTTEYVPTTYTTEVEVTRNITQIITDTITDTTTATTTATTRSISVSPTTEVTTQVTTSLVTLTATITFVTVSEIFITDSVTSTTSLTTTQVITTVSPTTITLPPITTTIPPVTVTAVSVITAASACPIPTNSAGAVVAPPDPKSDLTWGCPPGTVCNPPKPDGCNVYADLPDVSYVCGNSAWCIPSPSYPKVQWQDNTTSYYPPTEGYFNLAPAAFGLSDDIFAIEYVPAIINGTSTTISTGNWGSQPGLTAYPPSSTTATAYPTSKPRRLRSFILSKRGPSAPPICFDTCDNANIEAQSVGRSPQLCDANSIFRRYYDECQECIDEHSDDPQATKRSYLTQAFAQWFEYCDGTDTTTASSGGGGQSEVSSTEGGTTIPGATAASTTTAVPISPISSESSTESSTESSSESTSESTTPSPSTSVQASSTSSPAASPPATVTPTGNYTIPSPTPLATAGARGSATTDLGSLFFTLVSMFFLF